MITFSNFVLLKEDVSKLRDKISDNREAVAVTKTKIKDLNAKMVAARAAGKSIYVLNIIQLDIQKNELKLRMLDLDSRSTSMKISLANESFKLTFENFINYNEENQVI